MASTIFRSFKTIKAIPAETAAVRDALIHLTFDPKITAIDYFEKIVVGDTCVHAHAIFVYIAMNRYLLEITPSKQPPRRVVECAERLGISRKVITDKEVRERPRYANEQEVWRHADGIVPVHLRMQVFSQIRERGVVAMDELIKSLQGFGPTREALLTLACFGLILIDLGASLSPSTLVRIADR